jgi:hypothetical protein
MTTYGIILTAHSNSKGALFYDESIASYSES